MRQAFNLFAASRFRNLLCEKTVRFREAGVRDDHDEADAENSTFSSLEVLSVFFLS